MNASITQIACENEVEDVSLESDNGIKFIKRMQQTNVKSITT